MPTRAASTVLGVSGLHRLIGLPPHPVRHAPLAAVAQ